jgi:type IV secretion system protein VirB9
MIRVSTLVFLAALTATPALAVVPRPGAGDPRIHVVEYDPEAVVELRVALGYQLSVEFDQGERIENVAIGDSLGWQVTPNRRANLLFLKPMAQRPATNMTVVTNLRRYNFELGLRPRATARRAPFSVRFLYAPPAVAFIAPPPPPAPPEERNVAYSYEGSSKTLPVKVFDDGRDTYFAFRAEEDLPAIFALDPDGGEAVVNTRQRDGYVVVDRVVRGFVLRRGSEVTKVYNDGFRVEEATALRQRKKDPWWRR